MKTNYPAGYKIPIRSLVLPLSRAYSTVTDFTKQADIGDFLKPIRNVHTTQAQARHHQPHTAL
jgi:hypothetical protein